jgi:deoxyribodipyrimidine photo-lyase
MADYATRRDVPAAPATSRLSPHLHFGEIGPRQVFAAATATATTADAAGADVETFQKELGWREFNHHVLFHNPDIATRNFRDTFDGFPWRDDPVALEAWKRGRTGYPIVDAGMRELWTTGWMHNRVRMIAASFLTKHLMTDWRDGEAWFWDTLVDADLANNVANWQWVAGSGADAAPYFRIFNPVLQGAKYDPEGDYVRRWIPELAGLPDAVIHQPWNAEPEVLRAAGVRLGSDYPARIVEHSMARDRAMAAFRGLGAPLPSGRE